jgi:hypothetical protein
MYQRTTVRDRFDGEALGEEDRGRRVSQRMLAYPWQPRRREVAVQRGEGVRLVERVAGRRGEDEAVDGGHREPSTRLHRMIASGIDTAKTPMSSQFRLPSCSSADQSPGW